MLLQLPRAPGWTSCPVGSKHDFVLLLHAQGSCHYKDVYSMKWYAAYPDTMDGFSGSW